MKWTRVNVEKFVKEKGLEPVQIDGIPEGFSFKEPDVTIGGRFHKGELAAFFPLHDWSDGFQVRNNEKDLLAVYKEKCRKK